MNTRIALTLSILLFAIVSGFHGRERDSGESPASVATGPTVVAASTLAAASVKARASDSDVRIASYPIDVLTLPPAADRFDDGKDRAQGQGDADSLKSACEAAKDDCRSQLTCDKDRQKVEPRCSCWKGGENGQVCQVQCSCKPAPNS